MKLATLQDKIIPINLPNIPTCTGNSAPAEEPACSCLLRALLLLLCQLIHILQVEEL
jgi:hypothetical protein